MISGKTTVIAHVGYPTHSFKAPMIYNPYFEREGIDAVVVPMGVKAEDFATAFPAIMRFANVHGALITMPHKVSVVALLDEVTPTVQIAGSCNAVLVRGDGTLLGDMFDGEGFVRGVQRKGRKVEGARVLIVGSGGVGSAIAASFARAGAGALGLFDISAASAEALAARIGAHYPDIALQTGSNDPEGYDIVVNATPMGMETGDPMPMEVSRIMPSTFVGEVVMKQEMTAFLQAAAARGCQYQVGTDMLFEQIPAYLEFFGFRTTSPEVLREVATLRY
jgi:shikimate dehydrogenase